MKFDRNIFYIEEEKLSKTLDLTLKAFDELVDSLIYSDNESIRLKESIHFAIQRRIAKQPVRVFSREGVFRVIKYLEQCGSESTLLLNKIQQLLKEYDINQIDAEIRKKIYENSSAFIFRYKRTWLSIQATINILDTNSKRLKKAIEDIQKSDSPMNVNEDFESFEDFAHENGFTYYFSISGLEKLSLELSLKLRSAERREYCQRVKEVAPPVFEFLALAPSPSHTDIDRAMKYAKNRDGHICQVTRVSRNKYSENRHIEVVAHHLYDKSNYPYLADFPDNILTISKLVSEDFHQSNGGNQQSCTIDDFIQYVEWRYPENHEVILMLYNRRSILMLKLAQFQQALPESDEEYE